MQNAEGRGQEVYSYPFVQALEWGEREYERKEKKRREERFFYDFTLELL
jgi:hypothetical protein